MKRCVECGTLCKNEEIFCPVCGVRLSSAIREETVFEQHEERTPDDDESVRGKAPEQEEELPKPSEGPDHDASIEDEPAAVEIQEEAGPVYEQPDHGRSGNDVIMAKGRSNSPLYAIIGVLLVTVVILIIALARKQQPVVNPSYGDLQTSYQSTVITTAATPAPTIHKTEPTPAPTPAPTPRPTPTPRVPGPDDIRGCNDRVVYPNGTWLSDYETKYVKTKHGVRAYLRYEPKEGSDYYSYVYERDMVTVLARQNGYSLVKTTDGMAGWVTSSVLVDSY